MRRVLPFILSTALLACGGDDGSPDGAAGDVGPADGRDPADSNVDAPGPDTSTPTDSSVDAALPPGDPFEAPPGTWTAFAIEGAVCGNGSPMYIAVNPLAGSDQLMVYFQGGGACWDAETCFELDRATHVAEDVEGPTVIAEATTLSLFDRANLLNPFASSSFVYIPYCTGDLHFGTRVTSYDTAEGSRDVHHVGATNTDLILARAAATWPTVPRVRAVGISAGGYGVTVNWWRVAQFFSSARVDALSDSGIPIAPVDGRWDVWTAAWAPRHPPGCGSCVTEGLPAYLPHYATTRPSDARYGLLAYQQDAVIAGYFGLSGAEVASRLATLRDGMAATTSQRVYEDPANSHVLLAMPGRVTAGVSVLEWVWLFATDDPAWVNVAP